MLLDLDHKVILVTGGAGFMGSAFIRHILSLASFTGKVINYDALTYSGNLANLASCDQDPRYRFIQGDILDQEVFEKVLVQAKVDVVVHFAAETHVDRSIRCPLSFMETNVLGTFSLLEVMKKYPSLHFHHISTDEVYGSLQKEGCFVEDSPYLPNSPYAASKASSDHLVRSYAKTYGLSTTTSHAGNNYGPYQYPEKLIPLMILRLIHKEALPLYGQGDQCRDWLYVEDHSKAIEAILRRGIKGEVYNISGGKDLSNLELVKLLIHNYYFVTGVDKEELESRIVFTQDRPGHDFRYAMDGTKMHTQLKWFPEYTLEEGLEKTVHWYLENQQWFKHRQNGEYLAFINQQYSMLKLGK
jgi:dTDP-glucose 4,6-dehydratase